MLVEDWKKKRGKESRNSRKVEIKDLRKKSEEREGIEEKMQGEAEGSEDKMFTDIDVPERRE